MTTYLSIRIFFKKKQNKTKYSMGYSNKVENEKRKTPAEKYEFPTSCSTKRFNFYNLVQTIKENDHRDIKPKIASRRE